MWDRSYRWQQHVRLAAGGVLVVLLAIGAGVLARTSAATRAGEGARDLAGEIFHPSLQTFEVQVPEALLARVGTLVYRERKDGVAQTIGRVVAVTPGEAGQVTLVIRLSGTGDQVGPRGGILKGAAATINLREALELLLSPSTPTDEAIMARDIVWPSIKANVLPGIVDGLIREVSKDLSDPLPESAELFKQLFANLHQSIEPLENELVERLARRAWDVVGVKGLAGVAWRATANDAKAKGAKVADFWSWLMRNEKKPGEPVDRPFLSEKTSEDLRSALEAEAAAFWNDNREKIIDAFKHAVDAERKDFEQVFRERWSGAIYERVVKPAWLGGEDKVIASIETYVTDFAERRLVTNQGGPRLIFAYLLRSFLDISDAPLLIFSPDAKGESQQVVYEPLLP
ncbi:MAG TPA: hypothetical protein VGJ26_03920 [Pirellulales bacterium]|jgi:hypothetical protein